MAFKITCPYCFKKFNDDEVHFRMETVFKSEDELDPSGERRALSDLEELDDSREKDNLIYNYRLRERFLLADDDRYEKFWEPFGGTTEINSKAIDTDEEIKPQQRPVYDPQNADERKVLFQGDFIRDDNGLVIGIADCFGTVTKRRVCKHCHNPLPEYYGKNPVKFISVIGITGAGKTVYLSQLLKDIQTYGTRAKLSAQHMSINERTFVVNNPVKMGEPLPEGTPSIRLPQPLYYNVVHATADGGMQTNTFVMHDIAGENCVSAEKMQNFGPFVLNADGFLLLIDPGQFSMWRDDDEPDVADPQEVLNTIYNAIVAADTTKKCAIPIAVSLAKGDKIAEDLFGESLSDVEPVRDDAGSPKREFNARDYNAHQRSLLKFIRENEETLHTLLENSYSDFNYFIFSALGTSVDKIVLDGKTRWTPAGPTNPKRIEEPLLWMFNRFKYIGENEAISRPTVTVAAPPEPPQKKKGLLGKLFGR
jgi:hypothetical protein